MDHPVYYIKLYYVQRKVRNYYLGILYQISVRIYIYSATGLQIERFL